MQGLAVWFGSFHEPPDGGIDYQQVAHIPPQSLSENSKGFCFRSQTGLAAKTLRAAGLFARGLRWLGPLASQASASQMPGVDLRFAQAVIMGCDASFFRAVAPR